MIARQILYCGQPAVVACDARCSKAWGIAGRPKVNFGDDPDDYAFLADDELGEAPADPGTYEGGHAKPTCAAERLNKWCVRECERSAMSRAGKANEIIETRDFNRRDFNMPWLHDPASGIEAGTATTEGRGPTDEGPTRRGTPEISPEPHDGR